MTNTTIKKPAKINLDGLGKNTMTCHGAEFAAVLRADLKARGAKGVTIRCGRGSGTMSITATIALSADDFRSAEEAAARDGWSTFFRRENYGVTVDGIEYHQAYEGRATGTGKYISCGSSYDDTSAESNFPVLRSFWRDEIARFDSVNHYHLTPKYHRELTTEAFERVAAIVAIIQSYNYDNSDSMTDYYDVGFHLDIYVKKPKDFTPREYMTDAERERLEKDLAAEAKAERERIQAWEREQEESRKTEALRAEQEAKDLSEIAAAVIVEDLPESEQYYILNLAGGIGKECGIEELRECANRPEDAYITRRVTFSNADALAKFSEMLTYDFDFVAGKGGTGTNDPRVTEENMMKLNKEQREQVKFYAVDSIAVYFGGALQLVINPEGYSYPRYCYIPAENTREITPQASAEIITTEQAAEVAPFYFPKPVTEQVKALSVGETVTVYQSDGWCTMKGVSGRLLSVERGNWAQYSGVYLSIQRGGKTERVFCRDGKEAAIFPGSPLPLPDSVIYSEILPSKHGATLAHRRDCKDELRHIIAYYSENGRPPLLDTVQR